MKRLTRRSEITKAAYFPNCFEGCDGVCANCDEETNYCETLAKYEDTGLTPEQIVEMEKLYLEKCRELAECQRRQQTWIPVSERLPKDREEVLVTRTGSTGHYVACDEYEEDYFKWASGATDDIIAGCHFQNRRNRIMRQYQTTRTAKD